MTDDPLDLAPHSIEAEEATLGALLMNPAAPIFSSCGMGISSTPYVFAMLGTAILTLAQWQKSCERKSIWMI